MVINYTLSTPPDDWAINSNYEDVFRSQLSDLCYNHLRYQRAVYDRGAYINSLETGIEYISIGNILNSNDELPNLSVFQLSSFTGDGADVEWYFGIDSFDYHVLVDYWHIINNRITPEEIINQINSKSSQKIVKLIR